MNLVVFKTRTKRFAINADAVKWVEPTDGDVALHLTDDTLYVDLTYDEVIALLRGLTRMPAST